MNSCLHRVRTAVAIVAVLALAGGCAATLSGTDIAGVPATQRATNAPQWPPPPGAARVRYERSVGTAADWGVSRSLFGRIADTFTGRHENRFVRPTGVAVRAGVLYVADPGAQSVFVFDSNRHKDLRLRRVGDTLLVSPVAVAPGPDGTLLIVDSYLKRVFVVDPDGRLLRDIAGPDLARPAAIAYDPLHGRIYVADSMTHGVLVFAPDGRLLRRFGANGLLDGEFNSPTHLAVTRDGRLLVTDALNFRVQVFDADGTFRAGFGRHGDGAGDFAAPKGVAADSHGQIYVADAMFDAIQAFRDDGQLLLGFGGQGSGAGQFWLPNGVFISERDVLYVADAYNRRIQVFALLTPPAEGTATP